MPVASLDHQDETFSRAFAILREAIDQEAFPTASVAVTHKDQLVALKSFGHIKEPAAPLLVSFARSGGCEVTPATLFDVASLTKAVATTTMSAILYERGLLELDAPVVGTLPEFLADSCGTLDPRRHDITFRMLLAHSSGLPAYEKLFLRALTREELLLAAITMPLSADPGTRAEYSDVGFIVLGAALERIAEESLDAFCQREIFGPLAMTNTTFNPPACIRKQIPPTADERKEASEECGAGAPAREKPIAPQQPIGTQTARSTFRQRIIQGEVQDENASILGGVAAHAGLFSTAQDSAIFAHAMLQCGANKCGAGTPARELPTASQLESASPDDGSIFHPFLRPETISLFTHRQPTPPGTSRALGWDTPSDSSQSGKYFGANSYGHLGYTGTSLWIDPDRQLSITLLTNRTWPDCSNQAIKQVRPKFHDAVVESLK